MIENHMLIKAVLFDMFDTLMLVEKRHDYASPSLARMYLFLRENGVSVAFDTFEEAYNKSRDELYAIADPNLEEPHFNVRLALTLRMVGYNYDADSPLVASASAEFCDEFMKYVTVDPDLRALFQDLHGKYKLGIISNFAIPECVTKLLQREHLDGMFDVVLVSGAVNKRKPSPEIFKKALKRLEVSASEAVFVGDTMDADVEGAKAVGMKSVYLSRRIEKVQLDPDFTIERLGELPSVLSQFKAER